MQIPFGFTVLPQVLDQAVAAFMAEVALPPVNSTGNCAKKPPLPDVVVARPTMPEFRANP